MQPNTSCFPRWFEEFEPGQIFATGGITVSESQILDFAQRFDPQFFHLDLPRAVQSPYGGLIASGFHTLALSFRLFIDTGLNRHSGLGGPGIDDLRWLKPVRPGDTLSCLIETVAARPSSKHADRGMVTWKFHVHNQHGEEVMTYLIPGIVVRRPAEGHRCPPSG
jgi:acyl dehydratase